VAYLSWFLSLVEFAGAIAVSVGVLTSSGLASFKQNYGFLLASVLSIGVAVDIIIAFSMWSYLSSRRQTNLEKRYVTFQKTAQWQAE
jgi:hypothetical protein